MPNKINKIDFFGQVFSNRSFQTLNDFNSSIKSKVKKNTIILIAERGNNDIRNCAPAHFISVLIENGFKLKVLFCDKDLSYKKISNEFIHLAPSEVDFFLLNSFSSNVLNSPIADVAKRSFLVQEWLYKNSSDNDIILSIDCIEDLFYSIESRNSGVGFLNNTFILTTKKTELWKKNRSATPILNPSNLNVFYMQKITINGLDLLVSDSLNFLNWLPENGFNLNPNKMSANLLPISSELLKFDLPSRKNITHNKLIFFFNPNTENDCLLFLDSLKVVSSTLLLKILRVTLVFDGIKINDKIKKSIKELQKNLISKTRLRIVKSTKQIIDKDRSVIIIPCFELFNSYQYYSYFFQGSLLSDQHSVLSPPEWKVFNHQPYKIAEYLKVFFNAKSNTLAKSINLAESNQDWCNTLLSLKSKPFHSPTKKPLVTVCISHFNRGDMLLNAIQSIDKQSYRNIEIIVIDDGSTDNYSLNQLNHVESSGEFSLPINVIYNTNSYIGASRNKGLAASNGEYILFMDDDNEAKLDEVEVFVKAALHGDADIYTCFSEVFGINDSIKVENDTIKPVALFLGANFFTGSFSNPFGDSNMFVKRQAALALGGFSELYKVGREDHEFLYRASLNGYKIQLIPKALYWYRLNKTRIRNSQYNQFSGLARVSNCIIQSENCENSQALRYLQGLSSVCGPWGVSDRHSKLKYSIVEFFRFILLKQPRLYNILKILRKRF